MSLCGPVFWPTLCSVYCLSTVVAAVSPMKLRRVRLPQNVTVWNRNQMSRICSRLGLTRSKLKHRVPWNRFFVSDDRQYIYCSIPKVACSSWILALLRLTGRDISRVNSVHRWWLTDRYLRRRIKMGAIDAAASGPFNK